jgi:hypothetical protein
VSGLACLKQLSLQDVYPEVLLIPEECCLDLQGEAYTMQQVFPGPCVSSSVGWECQARRKEYRMWKDLMQAQHAEPKLHILELHR